MTIQEIKSYLKKHFFLVFRYKSEYYTLKRSQSLFNPQYSLVATDGLSHLKNSLEELCEQVYMSNGTLLVEAIKHIEIPEWDDLSWKTYEAVRHNAIVHRNEIHFVYKQRNYWIAHTQEGLSSIVFKIRQTTVELFDLCTVSATAEVDWSGLPCLNVSAIASIYSASAETVIPLGIGELTIIGEIHLGAIGTGIEFDVEEGKFKVTPPIRGVGTSIEFDFDFK